MSITTEDKEFLTKLHQKVSKLTGFCSDELKSKASKEIICIILEELEAGDFDEIFYTESEDIEDMKTFLKTI